MADEVEVEAVIKVDNEKWYHGINTEADAKRMFHAAVADLSLRNAWTPTSFSLYVRRKHMRGQLRVLNAKVPAPVALPD